ncbi:hypothetical protein OG349_15320 [Streptomyces sp. NBC_01317]|uniref:hypothetical protein n=1 Tax=Streptomyces sp. NBC_01317 TaxID=2903822 RepID=UPI002E0FB239|nr:hypothetical protein OG349_15320 [Streptomyces sp. NBC_01317]
MTLPGVGAGTHHLRPPGGGDEWSAPADGTTLRPVPALATDVSPIQRDAVHDRRAEQGALISPLGPPDEPGRAGHASADAVPSRAAGAPSSRFKGQ